ncbi:MAG: SMP-30/gluconolactonase/LRE family protein, partial [Proteobacteria bacterium]|nr:SMP-30/gluconolactonase/LRE family protein [Pseudomonadota bacterium]
DSLKVLADNRVCVCTLIVGGISIIDPVGETEFIQFDDPMTTNLAFGGADMRDVWVTNSGLGKIRKVRWPYPGLKPAYSVKFLFCSHPDASLPGWMGSPVRSRWCADAARAATPPAASRRRRGRPSRTVGRRRTASPGRSPPR